MFVKPVGKFDAGLVEELCDDFCNVEGDGDVDKLHGPERQLEAHRSIHGQWEDVDPLRDVLMSVLLESHCGVEAVSQGKNDDTVNQIEGSMVFTPNSRQHQRLLQNYLKFDKYDVKMAEQAFLNWQFGINSAYPPGMLEREYGAFFPSEEEAGKLKVVHEKMWVIKSGWMKEEWDGTWKEMLGFYGSEEFKEARRRDGEASA